MGETIRLEMGDWLFNAGIVGLYNILKESDDDLVIDQQYMEFGSSLLDNFEEKYFKYLIDTYEKTLSWYKIISYEEWIKYYEETEFENFDKDKLENLNKYIRDTVKYYIKSASYKSVYGLLDSDVDILELGKELSTINLKKKETVEDKIGEIKATFEEIKVIIEFFKTEKARKYLASKNVIYNIIKNSWNGISFLNPQSKEKDVYVDYRNYFVEPTKEYIESEKSKFKYNCFVCDESMKDLKNDFSFLNAMGFDVSRKSSHVWNFNNDVAICPICKLIYSCVPAGMTYVYNKGIYVNDNSSMENAVKINEKLKNEVLKSQDNTRALTYRALVTSIQEEFNDKIKYELADIQLVRYEKEPKEEEGRYHFNILSKRSLQIIKSSKDDLDYLIKCGFKEINTYFSVYELVIDRLLNSQNLFTLIHKLIIHKLSNSKDSYFNMFHITRMLNINTRFLKGAGYMEGAEKDIVSQANSAGYYLRLKYKDKGSVDKLNGVSYRLLNALKTNNTDSFMDTLLNCYLYVKASVPKIFLDTLRNEENFKTIGYAFVAGLIEGKEEGGRTNDK